MKAFAIGIKCFLSLALRIKAISRDLECLCTGILFPHQRQAKRDGLFIFLVEVPSIREAELEVDIVGDELVRIGEFLNRLFKFAI